MDERTRIDVIAKQFERGLRCAGCSDRNIARIVELIKQKKIDAISLYASDEGFKVYELIISIDWNEYDKQKKDNGNQTDSIGGLQESGETIEVETYLDDLVKKTREKELRLSYWISFCGALRIRNPEEYYRLKNQLGFEDGLFGWMNVLGRDEVDFIPDLQELRIRIRDIKEVDILDSRRIKEKKALLLKCKRVAEQLTCQKRGEAGDYSINRSVFPIEVSLTFQGEKKAATLLGVTSLNDPANAELKQGIILSLTRKEESLTDEHRDKSASTRENTSVTVTTVVGGNRKPGLNDPCPCGSGKKYKHCCGKTSGNTSTKPSNIVSTTSANTNKPKQSTADVQRVDKESLNRVKRVRASLIFNLISSALLVAILALSKCEVPSSPWDYIVRFIPLVAWLGYYFVGGLGFDEEYDGSKKYNRALLVVLAANCLIIACWFITVIIGKEIVLLDSVLELSYNVYSLLIFALTAASSVKYLTDKDRSGEHITLFKNLSIVFCSVLAVLLVIGAVKQIKEFNALNVGDTVLFGSYEQDGNLSNGTEEISWTVHSIDDGKALLLSGVCLYAMPYNSDSSDNSWTNSDLRKWLNSEFYQSAFSSTEHGVICEKEITTERLSNKDGHTYGETYGEAEITVDKVFVPDLSEFYMLTSELNVSSVAKEVFSANNTTYGGENYQSMFWTRSPYGDQQNWAYGYITETEQCMSYSIPTTMYAMVRPAIYIDVELYSNLLRDNQEQDTSATDRSVNSVGGGWGDSDNGRPSYTIDQINTGVLGDVITFNSISDGKIGDEKFCGSEGIRRRC